MEIGLARSDASAHQEKLSELLRRVSDGAGDRISLGQIAQAMDDRSFGAFLVVFCLPNLVPLPPGATVILGLPLVFIACQMAFSRLDTIWLPRRLREYSFDNKAFSAVLDRFIPWMNKAERFIKPRFFSGNRMIERVLGLFALVLAVIVFLPIPLGNMGPSLALALMGLGMTERDGLMMWAGVIVGVVFGAIVGYVGYEILSNIPYFIQQIPDYWHGFLNFFG
ncbi:MAG: exopolysaccharide biosynthesis protein [Rhizobium sp.]|nr:exopolysaccharide biosynthesis protein [Rhizobium sp.]